MRRPIIAGNWKMNLDRAASVALADEVAAGARQFDQVELAVCPPFVYLDAVSARLAGSSVGLGAQDMYDQPNGAFTGEIGAAMLLDVGCRYVILGHSERRQLLGETDGAVHRKTKAALAAGLIPIVCVGELLAEREGGLTAAVIARQFAGSLGGLALEEIERVVIAYEPVWAIGTGKVATPAQAQEVHADLRKLIEKHYNAAVARRVRIQYGGSVKPSNAAELLSQPDIDGALVGGASLKASDFLGIVAGAAERRMSPRAARGAAGCSGSMPPRSARPGVGRSDSTMRRSRADRRSGAIGTGDRCHDAIPDHPDDDLAGAVVGLLDSVDSDSTRSWRRTGRCFRWHGRPKRLRHQGGRHLHPGHDHHGRDLDHPVRHVGQGVQLERSRFDSDMGTGAPPPASAPGGPGTGGLPVKAGGESESSEKASAPAGASDAGTPAGTPAEGTPAEGSSESSPPSRAVLRTQAAAKRRVAPAPRHRRRAKPRPASRLPGANDSPLGLQELASR